VQRNFASAVLIIAVCATAASAATQAGTKTRQKPSSVALEDHLRIRLQVRPHDSLAHKQLVELLRKKDAFRALVAEDATWIKNNPGEYVDLTELVSYAKTALHDPEFAIAQQRSFLAGTRRDDDEWDYDGAMDMLASDLNKRGRAQEALQIFDDLVRLNPQEAGFWADRSDALLNLGKAKEAIESLRHSLDLDSSLETIHEALAEALMKAHDLSGAEAEYRAAISVYQAQYKTGEPTNSLNSLVKGLVKIEAANHAEHSLAQMHLRLARVLVLQKKWDGAVTETQAALDADETGFGAYYLRAQIYDTEGDHKRADESRQSAHTAIQKLVKGSSHSAEEIDLDPRLLFLSEGAVDAESGAMTFPSEILSILEPRLAKLSPMERIMIAEAYLELGRVQDATRQWEKAISNDPKLDNAVAHADLGKRLSKVGSLRDALPHLQRAYELDPQNATYRMDYEATKQALADNRSTR
jgi:tetratricopeptide (TPR) repeat protein